MRQTAFTFFIGFVAFVVGVWGPLEKPEDSWLLTNNYKIREPAQNPESCPDLPTARSMLEKFKINFDLQGWNCEPEDIRTSFLIPLVMAKRFSFVPPTSWDPKVRESVMDLQTWLTRYAKSYEVDAKKADSTIAYFVPSTHKIFMTERIKNFSPLDVLGIIVHENRHAEAPRINHVLCVSGDFPQGQGACDQRFSTEWDKMGAYNFTLLFEIGNVLYNKNITEAERELLSVSAMTSLANRINIIPAELGYFYETLVILDEQSRLNIINPLTTELHSIAFEKDIERIDHSSAADEVSIFSKDGAWSVWNVYEGHKAPYQEALAGKRVLDARKSMAFMHSQVFDTYINAGSLEYLGFDDVSKKREAKNFRLLRDDVMPTNLKRIIFSEGMETTFITQEGELLRARKYGNEKAFAVVAGSESLRWVEGTSGPLFGSMFLTEEGGEVIRISLRDTNLDREEEQGARYMPPETSFSVLPLAAGYAVYKFYPGLNADYLLTQDGNIFVRPLNKKEFSPLRLNVRVKDFAVMKKYSVESPLLKMDSPLRKKFEHKCSVRSSSTDPWLGRPLGINQQQQLVLFDYHEDCKVLDVGGAVREYQLVTKADSKRDAPYARPQVRIVTESGVKLLSPYLIK